MTITSATIEINVWPTGYAYILGKAYNWEAVQAFQDGDEDSIVGYGETPQEAVENLLLQLED